MRIVAQRRLCCNLRSIGGMMDMRVLIQTADMEMIMIVMLAIPLLLCLIVVCHMIMEDQ